MITSNFRQLIRSNVTLYKLFLKVKSGYQYKFPTDNTDLHLTGYQRSGNTYTGNYCKVLFQEFKIVTHFHTISSLKSAFKYNVPVAVLIRHPEGAIMSSIVKRIDGMGLSYEKATKYDLNDYIDYYSYVLKNIERISLIKFEDAINHESKVVETVAKLLEVQCPDIQDINDALMETKEHMNSDLRNDGDRNMPSQYKEKKKDEIRKKVEENLKYQECVKLYDKLIATL